MDLPATPPQKQNFTVIPCQMESKDSGVILWLHDLGDNSCQWQDVFLEHLRLPHLKIIFPKANKIPYSLQDNRLVSTWFNKNSHKCFDSVEDNETFDSAVKMVHTLIKEQINLGISRIALGGFGYGGCLAMYAGLTCEDHLAGICCIGGYLPNSDTVLNLIGTNFTTPILFLHGSEDDIIPYEDYVQSVTFLASHMHVDSKHYPEVGHSLSFDGCNDLKNWFFKVLPLPPSSSRKKKHRKNKSRH